MAEQDQDEPGMSPAAAQQGDDPDVTDLENGDSIVTLPADEEEDAADEQEVEDHFANIVEDVDQSLLQTTINDLLDLIEKDDEAYKKRDKKNAEALQRTGLGDDAPGGATFAGASRVVHPGLIEASIDGAARIIKEIFPPDGPVKEKLIGDVTPEKFERAERKTKYMNWQFTQQMRSARDELEQLLPQSCLSGVAYLELIYDEQLKRPNPTWIPGDEMRLPFSATNYYSAERKTRVEDITEFQYQKRVKSDMYIDIDLSVSAQEPDQSETQKANAKIQGKSDTTYNEDGVRRIYRTQVSLDIEEEGDYRPYIISIDEGSKKSPALYRNWEPDDDKMQELQWAVEFPFVPWRGAYPIGLIHMIGGLSAATTGSLRALLDSAHINNMPTAMKLKGGDRGGQSQTLNPTQVNEVEGSFQTDDIRKTFMNLPFNPPSPVLFQLLGFLVEAAQGVVRTTYEDLASNSTNMPVGTTQALIEQGMVVFSAIHGRMHDAMGRVLEILHRINRTYLTDDEVVEELGNLVVRREDFEGPMDVIPVSDPNIFSDVQRTAQMQMVVARSDTHPELYQQLEVEKMLLRRTKIPDPEKLLRDPPKPTELNAVNENVAATMGRPIMVFPEQNHIAHLKTLIEYAINPLFGSNPIIAPSYLPAALRHIKDHLAMWYVAAVEKRASDASQRPIADFMGKDADVNQAIDDLLATASPLVMQEAQKLFQGLPEVIAGLQKLLQSFAPPPPMDPTQAAMADIQATRQTAQEKNQIEAQKITSGQQSEQQEQQAKTQQSAAQLAQDQKELDAKRADDAAKIAAEDARAETAERVKLETNQQDNDTAKQIAGLEAVVEHHKTDLKDGTGINPGTGP